MLGPILGAIGSIAGGLLGNKSSEKAAKENLANQKLFAQNSLQWKAQDAEKAGISKVFAMGAPTMSFTPSSVGGNFDFLGNAGQNIGRAMQAGQSNEQQVQGTNRQAQAIQLEGMGLDNDIKRAQLNSILQTQNQAGTPPGIPAPNQEWVIPGQIAQSNPELQNQTKNDVTSTSGNTGHVAGTRPGVGYYDTGMGGYDSHLASQLAEAFEQDETGSTLWQLRNRLLSPLGGSQYAPKFPVLPWQTRYFNPRLWQWENRDRSSFPNRSYGRFNTRR